MLFYFSKFTKSVISGELKAISPFKRFCTLPKYFFFSKARLQQSKCINFFTGCGTEGVKFSALFKASSLPSVFSEAVVE